MGSSSKRLARHNGRVSPLYSAWLLLACGAPIPNNPDSTATDTARPVDATTEQVPGTWTAPSWSPQDIPSQVLTVEITISPEAMLRLDADPFLAADEVGLFTDSEGVEHPVSLNYRGAYQLLNVMSAYDLRNWKVKLEDGGSWQRRSEWNFNYEPHLRQKLAYDLFRFAGVAVPGAQHVLLRINGEDALLYLAYEDPDNANWLWDQFGNEDGDLYKAATDLPDEPVCWADLTWLGAADSDYLCHYNKKTNRQCAPDDLAVIREFITELNEIADSEFSDWLESHVDVDGFLSYLVVSNFLANWDSYPQRPKNYWLYQDLRAGNMVYVPWDLDGTFNPYTDRTYNQMGTTADLFFNLLIPEYEPPHAEEGTERPLVRRMMAHESYQLAYLDRYQAFSESILSFDYLDDRATALTTLLHPVISATDANRLDGARASLDKFIRERVEFVDGALADSRQ
jgi:hypothetical protein